jgi:DNA-binding transcriptional MerR regulator
MQEYKVCEEAYQKGDKFFEDEHDVWITLEKQLQEQGYSYEEVESLKEHYRKEYARVRMQEGEIKRKLRIANSILKEIETEVQEKLEQREKEKIREEKQPIR